jgi:release factor glutamine methyltransferase
MNEIEAILCKLYQCDRSGLYLEPHRPLTPCQSNRLEALLKKRVGGEPLQYLVGDMEFMGLCYRVAPGVLIPRPETEILVQEALKEIIASKKHALKILDIGTGSGNIAISLAVSLKEADVYAVDISRRGLRIAEENARTHGVSKRIKFLESDLFESFEDSAMTFDFIISNPPYIPADAYDLLPEDVKREPRLALLAEDKGFSFYSAIEKGARRFLSAAGTLFLELGDGQKAGVKEIFTDRVLWKGIRFAKDYNGIDRIAVIKRV